MRSSVRAITPDVENGDDFFTKELCLSIGEDIGKESAPSRQRLKNTLEVPREIFEDFASAVLHNFPAGFSYHNRAHTADVLQKAIRIGSACGLDERGIQKQIVTALLHDYLHSGFVYRQLLKKIQDSPEASFEAFLEAPSDRRQSNEEFSGDCLLGAVLHKPELEFSLAEIYEMKETIHRSSYGQGRSAVKDFQQLFGFSDALAESLIREYQPETTADRIFALSDIVPPLDGPLNDEYFAQWMDLNFRVLKEDIPERLPKTYEEFLKNEAKFLDFVEGRLNALEAEMDKDMFSQISTSIEFLKEKLREESDPSTATASYVSQFEAAKEFVRRERSDILIVQNRTDR